MCQDELGEADVVQFDEEKVGAIAPNIIIEAVLVPMSGGRQRRRFLLHLLHLLLLLHEELELHVDFRSRLEVVLWVMNQRICRGDFPSQNQLVSQLKQLDEDHFNLSRAALVHHTPAIKGTVQVLQPLQLIRYLVAHRAQLG